ncbi:galactokinase [Wansuia hejianensis]|mgnify:CR=1 FL=1|uniref:Galactokinase n=1 Tax=Wansuia hejianensis TaxID=2763667 RepID=A0A7G9GF43_9FIRM|nr:galactokinase [Wansuia hejianensis]QNM09425.1 galactokinase [Wansuia hejianensis]RHV91987.1 galactokinase [Lachnospiraceae bacterium OF09-33XD]
MTKDELVGKFQEIYGGAEGVSGFFAPGRVNLIGEHTDYNGGHVLPCALSFGTWLLARKRQDRRLRFFSENFSRLGVIESDLEDLACREEAGWTNYPKGVIWAFRERGYEITQGLDVFVYGDVPSGAGLSSSASLEVAAALALRELFELKELAMTDLAVISLYSENHFNGLNCGIMDQFAAAMGKKDSAIFLDTDTLAYEYVNARLDHARIVITNSKVKHSLVDSAYNDRKRESDRALKMLQRAVDIRGLGDLTEEDFERCKEAIQDTVCEKRARHAVYENRRTIRAAAALNAGRIEEFGKLMNESHRSLRDDYEVSCREVDTLVEIAWEIPGVLGSRITGGGFGGCTVSIVEQDAFNRFRDTVVSRYREKTGITAEIYAAEIGDGARRLW